MLGDMRMKGIRAKIMTIDLKMMVLFLIRINIKELIY